MKPEWSSKGTDWHQFMGDVTRCEWAHGLLRAVVEPGGVRTEIGYDGDKNVSCIRNARDAEIRAAGELARRGLE
ncbi:MAG: hypothetical protein IT379_36690 [Deltaproteobacteria bacterium]|nr:hypothetical protein [Deltaproteobacteria bacterium]